MFHIQISQNNLDAKYHTGDRSLSSRPRSARKLLEADVIQPVRGGQEAGQSLHPQFPFGSTETQPPQESESPRNSTIQVNNSLLNP